MLSKHVSVLKTCLLLLHQLGTRLYGW